MHNNKGKKKEDTGIEVCTIYLCWGDSLKRPKKKDCRIARKVSRRVRKLQQKTGKESGTQPRKKVEDRQRKREQEKEKLEDKQRKSEVKDRRQARKKDCTIARNVFGAALARYSLQL